MDENDLESVIEFLRTEKGLKMNDIIEAVGLTKSRPHFYDMRSGKKPFQKKLLLDKIKAALPEHFTAAPPKKPANEPNAGSAIEIRYIELLEKSVEEIRAERDKLKMENEKLVREIRDLLKQPEAM